MIRNLTTDNFFDELHDAFPEAVEYFWKWFYGYQKEVGWHELFPERTSFGDIPFEMQNGIIARFELELFNNTKGRGKEEYVAIAEQYKGQMRNLFADLQKQIEKLKKSIR